MSKFLILLIADFPIVLAAKETKKIVRVPYPAFSETFYVLKSDTGIRHGSYQAAVSGKVIVSGFYKMGKQDSIWIRYNLKGKIRARGWFNDDKRDSIWEFFNDKGELEQKLDFTSNQVLYYQTLFAEYPFKIISKADTIMTVLDRPPLFIGGTSRFNDYVADEIHIPLHKATEKVIGTVFITFTVDSLGRTSNHRVLKGFGKACNEEALRVMKTIPDEWIPGVLNGKQTTVDYIVPFKFDQLMPIRDNYGADAYRSVY